MIENILKKIPIKNPNNAPLLNLNKCEKLYQEDKFQKQEQEIDRIKQFYSERNLKEFEFYQTLNLDEKTKKKFFNIDAKPTKTKKFFMVQDPILGNLIMTKDNNSSPKY